LGSKKSCELRATSFEKLGAMNALFASLSSRLKARSSQLLQQDVRYFLPVVDAAELGILHVVRGGEHELFTVKGFQVMRQVIDHVVAVDDDLAAAEYDLFPGKEGKMFAKPLLFFAEGLGEFHGSRYDKERVFTIELLDDLLAVFVGCHLSEKTLLIAVALHRVVIAGEALAVGFMVEAIACYTHTKITFIIGDELAGGVGDYIVHVYYQALHSMLSFKGRKVRNVHSPRSTVHSKWLEGIGDRVVGSLNSGRPQDIISERAKNYGEGRGFGVGIVVKLNRYECSGEDC
jgi:hypothetical protein